MNKLICDLVCENGQVREIVQSEIVNLVLLDQSTEIMPTYFSFKETDNLMITTYYDYNSCIVMNKTVQLLLFNKSDLIYLLHKNGIYVVFEWNIDALNKYVLTAGGQLINTKWITDCVCEIDTILCFECIKAKEKDFINFNTAKFIHEMIVTFYNIVDESKNIDFTIEFGHIINMASKLGKQESITSSNIHLVSALKNRTKRLDDKELELKNKEANLNELIRISNQEKDAEYLLIADKKKKTEYFNKVNADESYRLKVMNNKYIDNMKRIKEIVYLIQDTDIYNERFKELVSQLSDN